MKKVIALVLSLALAISVSTAFAAETVSIIGTPNPHIEILEAVKDDMAALGYELDLIVTADYTTENPAHHGRFRHGQLLPAHSLSGRL